MSTWPEIAHQLAKAMHHSAAGVCTLTAAEHDALAAYHHAVSAEASLEEALDRYALHSLDGHAECGDDCEIQRVRLSLPDDLYRVAIGGVS